jgi:hypothetical protein
MDECLTTHVAKYDVSPRLVNRPNDLQHLNPSKSKSKSVYQIKILILTCLASLVDVAGLAGGVGAVPGDGVTQLVIQALTAPLTAVHAVRAQAVCTHASKEWAGVIVLQK